MCFEGHRLRYQPEIIAGHELQDTHLDSNRLSDLNMAMPWLGKNTTYRDVKTRDTFYRLPCDRNPHS